MAMRTRSRILEEFTVLCINQTIELFGKKEEDRARTE